MIRSLLLFFCVTSLMAVDAPTWIEAESATDAKHPAQAAGWAAGGRFLDFVDVGSVLAFPISLDRPLADAGLWVRWTAGSPDPVAIAVVLAPADAQGPNAAGARELGTLSLARDPGWTPQPNGGDWSQPRWAALHIGTLPAGQQRVFLIGRGGNGNCTLDALGIGAWHDGLYRPPGKVHDGRLGAGELLQPVTVERVAQDDDLGLYAAEDRLGANTSPITLRATLRNNRTDRALAVVAHAVLYAEEGDVAALPAQSVHVAAGGSVDVAFAIVAPGYGWYGVRIEVRADGVNARGETSFAVIRPAAQGVRPDSLFGLNLSSDNAPTREIARRIGVKWRRGIPDTSTDLVAPKPGMWWTAEAIAKAKAGFQAWRDAGVLCLGYVNYNTPWNARTQPGRGIHQVPPADLAVHAEAVRRMIEPFANEMPYWELWNEPVPGGHFWGGTASDYRAMVQAVADAVRPTMPQVKLLGGSYTHSLRDMVLAGDKPTPLDGSVSHPYQQPNLYTPASGALERAMLERYAPSRGAAGVWFTEIGTLQWGGRELTDGSPRFAIARSIAPIYLLNQIGVGPGVPCKVFLFCLDYRGNGDPSFPGNLYREGVPDPAIAAYSAMTHFLEDGVLQGDLWATTKHGWAIHYRKSDGTSVVALWPERGTDATLDRTVRIAVPALDFAAYDRFGRPAGRQDDSRIELTARTWDVHYLVSRKPADQVAAAVRAATLGGVEPLRVAIKSLTAPLSLRPTLRVRVENRMLQATKATLAIAPPPALRLERSVATVELAAGESTFAEFPIAGGDPNLDNSYRVAWTLHSAFGDQHGEQLIQVACALRGTPAIGGSRVGWDAAVPVRIRSPGKWNDWWNEPRPLPMEVGDGYQLWTLWDDRCFYIAAEARDVSPRPGDCLQLGFDCLERNPDDLLAKHPLRAKCLASDIDYEFKVGMWKPGEYTSAIPDLFDIVPKPSTAEARSLEDCVPQLVRLCAPGTRRCNPPTQLFDNPPTDPPLGPMRATADGGKDGRVHVAYDSATKTWRYEAAIPWEHLGQLGPALRALKAGAVSRTRFTFHVVDQNDWYRRTMWEETEGDVEFAAEGFAFRPGTPCWSNDYQLRILAEWGFVR